jgi:pectate lyase
VYRVRCGQVLLYRNYYEEIEILDLGARTRIRAKERNKRKETKKSKNSENKSNLERYRYSKTYKM